MSFERDEVEIVGGIRHGVTLGSPIAIRVGNSEWPKWQTVMAADPVDPAQLADLARNAPLPGPVRATPIWPHRRPAPAILERQSSGDRPPGPTCMRHRSAWPGRGRVSGRSGQVGELRRVDRSAAITVCHFGHSLLPTRIAIGLPSVTPCRMPPTISTSSRSKLMRAPRP